jgi:DNA-binding transcriptional regulator YiaG
MPYRGCGLDNIVLMNGFECIEDDDGEMLISVHDVDGLHRAIADYLIINRKQLSGKEIRFIRRQMGLSQSEMGIFMRLSDQQIARYEKDQFQLTGATDVLFRGFYKSFAENGVNLRQMANELLARDEEVASEIRLVRNMKSTRPTNENLWQIAA